MYVVCFVFWAGGLYYNKIIYLFTCYILPGFWCIPSFSFFFFLLRIQFLSHPTSLLTSTSFCHIYFIMFLAEGFRLIVTCLEMSVHSRLSTQQIS